MKLVPSSSVLNLTTSTTQQNATSMLVTWNVPVLNDLNGVLLNYSINYSGIEIDTVPRVIYLSNPTLTNQSIILTNLEEYTTYSINVSAYTKVGRGPDAVVSQRTNQDGELLPNSISFYFQWYANEFAYRCKSVYTAMTHRCFYSLQFLLLFLLTSRFEPFLLQLLMFPGISLPSTIRMVSSQYLH